ncbi:MAG: diacylglycerol kinase family protein [Acidobacteriota bacterium]
MKRALVLLNRAAGSGRAGALWRRLEHEVAELETCEVVVAASAAAARDQLMTHLRARQVERLIAIGGDGTAHLAVDALLAAERGDVGFGLLAAGTGSDFDRHLQRRMMRMAKSQGRRPSLETDPARRLSRILRASDAQPIDAIEMHFDDGERRFGLNIASAGLSGAVDAAVERGRRHGSGSYLRATLGVLARYRPPSLRVAVDDELIHDGPLFLVAMANGSSFGKGMLVAPDAEIDDGLLDVVLVPPQARWKLPWLLPQFLAGRHVRRPQILVRRAREVRLEPAKSEPPFDFDGETLSARPARIRCLPRAIRLLG